jgi:collagenase-like PrtC family protease
MAGLEFSIPYNSGLSGGEHSSEGLEEIFRLNKLSDNSVREIYLSGPQEYFASGRIMPKMSGSEFVNIIGKIHKEGIRVNLVINSTCEGSDWYSPRVLSKNMRFLGQVHEEHGVEAITIANPLYIKEVRKHFPHIEICASVLGDIDCLQRALIYADLGVNIITPDANINRDIDLLKTIKKNTGLKLKIMVNEGCIYKCPFRKFHFNYMSHASKELHGAEYFISYCHNVIQKDPSQILKSGWIRPEDMREYVEITSFFKIVGRALPLSKVNRAISAYMSEKWDGDILDIVSSSLGAFGLRYGTSLSNKSLGDHKFFYKITNCEMNCKQCGYCGNLINKLLKFGHITEEKLIDIGYNQVTSEI